MPANARPEATIHAENRVSKGRDCGPLRPKKRHLARGAVLALVHVAMIAHFLHWRRAGRTLSPVEPSEVMQTLELGYLNAGAIFFAVAILATLIFGRFVCGWACHVVAYQDLAAYGLAKLGLKPKPVRARLLVYVPLAVAFYMFAWPTLERWLANRPAPKLTAEHLFTDQYWQTFPGPWIGALTVLVCGGLLVWFLGGKGFCTYGCPYGALFGLADRAAPGRIRVTDACEGCAHCTAVCTSNVRVHEEVRAFGMVKDPGCMKCLDCVSVCPKDALYFGFSARATPRERPARPARRFDFTLTEELVVLAVGFVYLLAWRGAYDKVPFFLAIGLGVISAVVALTLWRLLRSKDALRLQRYDLKRAGRLTTQGLTLVPLFAAFLAFGAHSGLVRWHDFGGERALAAASELTAGDPAREGLVVRARERLLAAERWGLFPVAKREHKLGEIAQSTGDFDEAERRMTRALAIEPRSPHPLFWLTYYRMRDARNAERAGDLADARRQAERAEEFAARLLTIRPDFPRGEQALADVRAYREHLDAQQ